MNINITQAISKMQIPLVISFLVILFFSGCQSSNPTPSTIKSSLQLQAVQSKIFESDKKIVFASIMSVFQDLGYAINSADLETGFISAKSPTVGKYVFGTGQVQNYLSATAFIETSGNNKTRVRLNFINIEKTDGYQMQGGNDTPIEDPKVYQDRFDRIQKAIFVRSNL